MTASNGCIVACALRLEGGGAMAAAGDKPPPYTCATVGRGFIPRRRTGAAEEAA